MLDRFVDFAFGAGETIAERFKDDNITRVFFIAEHSVNSTFTPFILSGRGLDSAGLQFSLDGKTLEADVGYSLIPQEDGTVRFAFEVVSVQTQAIP